MHLVRIARPPEIQLQRFLGENSPLARRIARFVCSGRIREAIGVAQSFHVDRKVIHPRIDIFPSGRAPHALSSSAVLSGIGWSLISMLFNNLRLGSSRFESLQQPAAARDRDTPSCIARFPARTADGRKPRAAAKWPAAGGVVARIVLGQFGIGIQMPAQVFHAVHQVPNLPALHSAIRPRHVDFDHPQRLEGEL